MMKRLPQILMLTLSMVLLSWSLHAEVSFTVSPSNDICIGDEITVTNTSDEPSADGFMINFGDGTITQISGSISHTYEATGTFTVSVTAVQLPATPLGSATQQMTVSGPTEDFFLSSQSACPGEEIQFSYTGDYNKLIWDVGNGGITNDQAFQMAYEEQGSMTVTLTIETDCDTIDVVKVIEVEPSGDFDGFPYAGINADAMCPGAEIEFYAGDGLTYDWAFGDGDTDQGEYVSHMFAEGNYMVSVTISDACGNDSLIQLPIDISTPMYFENNIALIQNDDLLCLGAELELAVYGEGEMSYDWDLGVNQSDAEDDWYISTLFDAEGNYPISVTVTDICGADTVLSTDVTITESANRFTGWAEAEGIEGPICPGAPAEYHVNGEFNAYIWDFSDGTTASGQEVDHAFASADVYDVSVTLTDYCNADTTVSITTTVAMSGEFSGNSGIDVPSQVCPDTPIDIEAGDGNASYYWLLGDGTILNTGKVNELEHTYTNTGTYEIKVHITDYCGQTTTDSAEINVNTGIGIEYFEVGAEPDTICPGDAATGYAWGQGVIEYFWNVGDGPELGGNQETYVFEDEGDYTVTVTMINGCGADTSVTFDVVAGNSIVPNEDDFDWEIIPTEACPGDSVLFVAFPTGAATYVWNFDDGTTAGTEIFEYDGDDYDVAHNVYDELGNYFPELTITNGCGNSITVSADETVKITANQAVEADINVNNESGLCKNVEVEFNGFGATDYVWDFGDGTTVATSGLATAAEHTYSASGNYTVSVEVTNACLSTATETVEIYVGECVVTGMSTISEGRSGLQLYPNPAQSFTSISMPDGAEFTGTLVVSDIQGRVMQTVQVLPTNVYELSTSDLASGIYIVEMETANTKAVARLTIE